MMQKMAIGVVVVAGLLIIGVTLTVMGFLGGTAVFVGKTVEREGERESSDGRYALKRRLGNLDGIKPVQLAAHGNRTTVYFRFHATSEQISKISTRLNLPPLPMSSVADHGLTRQASDPEWWRPETEMVCCTRYSGPDISAEGTIFLGYNPKIKVAYVVYTPAAEDSSSRRRY